MCHLVCRDVSVPLCSSLYVNNIVLASDVVFVFIIFVHFNLFFFIYTLYTAVVSSSVVTQHTGDRT